MEFATIDLYTFHLKNPVFDITSDIFKSIFQDNNETNCKIRTSSLKLNNIVSSDSHSVLELEFLTSGNDFYKFIQNLDAYIKNDIINNGMQLIGKEVNPETIDNLFKKSIKLPETIPSLPYINCYVSKNNNTIGCKVINKNGRKISHNNIKTDIEIELCLHPELELHKNKCHLSFIADEIKIINNVCPSLEDLLKQNNDDTDDSNNDEV
jgi:hypothetical protein